MKHVVSQKQQMQDMMLLLFIIALQLSAMQNINKPSYELHSGFYELELCPKMTLIFGSRWRMCNKLSRQWWKFNRITWYIPVNILCVYSAFTHISLEQVECSKSVLILSSKCLFTSVSLIIIHTTHILTKLLSRSNRRYLRTIRM